MYIKNQIGYQVMTSNDSFLCLLYICAISVCWDNYQHLMHSSTVLFLQELLKTLSVDAYVVVFSVNNPSTFQIAKDNLNKIRNELKINKTIILVANKIDLVRKRAVPANGITIFFFILKAFFFC